MGHPAEVGEGGSPHLRLLQIPADGQALLELGPRCGELALQGRQVAQADKGGGGAEPVVEAAAEGQAVLVEAAGGVVVALMLGQDRGPVEGDGP